MTTNPLGDLVASLGHAVVVTGTDTDVGKTYATAALVVSGWNAGRRRIAVYKPQQTGMRGGEPGDVDDVALLARAAGVPSAALTTTEGQRLTEPMAPPPAAAIDGVELLPLSAHVAKIVELQESHDLVVVEGSGGVLVELDGQRHTVADLAVALQETSARSASSTEPDGAATLSPATAEASGRRGSSATSEPVHAAERGGGKVSTVLVVRPDLGTLNHTLLSLEALLHRGVRVAGVVLGSWPTAPEQLLVSNRAYLENLTFIARYNRATEEVYAAAKRSDINMSFDLDNEWALGVMAARVTGVKSETENKTFRRIPLLGAVPRGWGTTTGGR
ncbi:ATP-dependent dethiobiotin synthetase BioD [Kocuria rhizophila]|uniref:ATP-dependent dethiobiotin synthetase BioD n=1 Tax=Kocuria rhizophila (strain ATCC 9341 / DSM 348 / NBRC 103217 / DC2201) TaxID=378753 RepID=B2GLR0_KOCRD|nr:ATP-dependent dethiobiotin synthetase BioD [Kocuria rhizophila]BAG28594.1 dethiobiotin synthetase [Kocuria rhizophila DC2201]VEH76104.1 ATP-dependent dethiobiotin synthetase BioD [Kocuria rhizophila]